MAQYIKKLIENANGGVAEAWAGQQLVVNLPLNRASVKESGWRDGQYIADGKGECVPPINWVEPDVKVLLTTKEYPIGTPVADIVFEVIATRMLTLTDKPDGTGPNPFLGGALEEVPEPSAV